MGPRGGPPGETANLQGSTQKEFLPKGFPGNGCFWIGAVSCETAVEFIPLRIGQRRNLRSLREAVPQVLGELNPLRYRQTARIHDGLSHPLKIEARDTTGKVSGALVRGSYIIGLRGSMSRWDRFGELPPRSY